MKTLVSAGAASITSKKIALVLASMRDHAAALERAGFQVHYFVLEQQQTTTRALAQLVARYQPEILQSFEVTDVHRAFSERPRPF